MGTMMSAASSTERFPAPVPIGGTVRLVNSHSCACCSVERHARATPSRVTGSVRSEEHTSELQSRLHLVCRLLLEKKKRYQPITYKHTSYHSTTIAFIA